MKLVNDGGSRLIAFTSISGIKDRHDVILERHFIFLNKGNDIFFRDTDGSDHILRNSNDISVKINIIGNCILYNQNDLEVVQ